MLQVEPVPRSLWWPRMIPSPEEYLFTSVVSAITEKNTFILGVIKTLPVPKWIWEEVSMGFAVTNTLL